MVDRPDIWLDAVCQTEPNMQWLCSSNVLFVCLFASRPTQAVSSNQTYKKSDEQIYWSNQVLLHHSRGGRLQRCALEMRWNRHVGVVGEENSLKE
jgi:hypothetical protein